MSPFKYFAIAGLLIVTGCGRNSSSDTSPKAVDWTEQFNFSKNQCSDEKFRSFAQAWMRAVAAGKLEAAPVIEHIVPSGASFKGGVADSAREKMHLRVVSDCVMNEEGGLNQVRYAAKVGGSRCPIRVNVSTQIQGKDRTSKYFYQSIDPTFTALNEVTRIELSMNRTFDFNHQSNEPDLTTLSSGSVDTVSQGTVKVARLTQFFIFGPDNVRQIDTLMVGFNECTAKYQKRFFGTSQIPQVSLNERQSFAADGELEVPR